LYTAALFFESNVLLEEHKLKEESLSYREAGSMHTAVVSAKRFM
jgi:hypothetical protein